MVSMRVRVLGVFLAALIAGALVPAPAEAALACEGLLRTVLSDGFELCTHGDDSHLAADNGGVGGDEPGAPVPAASAQCFGDGTDGVRVEVFYVYGQSAGSRFVDLEADIRRWTAQAEWTIAASAEAKGGRRHLRFATERASSGCRPVVRPISVSSAAIGDFAEMVDALRAKGLDRNDRKYLLFADDDTYCGLGSAPDDDRAGDGNLANRQAGYARVDRPCWTNGDQGFYSVAAHEIVHTLGAVQTSAPHATTNRHCSDEYDLMCYVDGAVDLTYPCVDKDRGTAGRGDKNDRLLDCGGDDYFNPAPAAGSYLATHWNTASSLFLSPLASTGAGYPGAPSTTDDPRGRTKVWPQGDLGGPHRPTVPGGFGWEVCDLPIDVVVDTAVVSGADLPTEVRSAAQRINAAIGTTALKVRTSSVAQREPAAGELIVRWGRAADVTHVDVRVKDARIRGAVVTLDRDLVPAGPTRTLVLQAIVQALGVGRAGAEGTLMAPVAVASPNTTTAFAALRHLYKQSCSVDPRLDDTAGGDDSQRRLDGLRRSLDLARTSRSLVEAGVAVSTWLRDERGRGWADTAVICRDDVFADCLAGTALAGRQGVLMLVPGGSNGSLPTSVGDELDRALGSFADVVILGGAAAVSERIESQLQTRLGGRVVRRIAGPDRYATAAAIAAEVATSTTGQVLVARGDNPADAVAAGAFAADRGVPIVLTGTHSLPGVTAERLRAIAPDRLSVLGGTAAVSDAVVDQLEAHGTVARIAGRTRTETTVAVAKQLWQRTTVGTRGAFIGLNGWHAESWGLAVLAAPVGAYLDAPVLFTNEQGLPSAAPAGAYPGDVREYLRGVELTNSPELTTVFVGGSRWAGASAPAQFHINAVPGFDGNVEKGSVSSTGSSGTLLGL